MSGGETFTLEAASDELPLPCKAQASCSAWSQGREGVIEHLQGECGKEQMIGYHGWFLTLNTALYLPSTLSEPHFPSLRKEGTGLSPLHLGQAVGSLWDPKLCELEETVRFSLPANPHCANGEPKVQRPAGASHDPWAGSVLQPARVGGGGQREACRSLIDLGSNPSSAINQTSPLTSEPQFTHPFMHQAFIQHLLYTRLCEVYQSQSVFALRDLTECGRAGCRCVGGMPEAPGAP